MFLNLVDGFTLLSVILLIAGFVLVGIEMTVPGISIPGIAGIVCLILSVFLIADDFVEGIVMTTGILAILGMMLAVILWLLAKGKLVQPIILTEQQTKESGYLSSQDLEYLVGTKGIASTDLRPSGIGNFDGVNLDIITEGQYITKDTPVEIMKVQGSKLVVRASK